MGINNIEGEQHMYEIIGSLDKKISIETFLYDDAKIHIAVSGKRIYQLIAVNNEFAFAPIKNVTRMGGTEYIYFENVVGLMAHALDNGIKVFIFDDEIDYGKWMVKFYSNLCD